MLENSLYGMKKNQTRKYPENRLSYFMAKCKLEKEDIAEALKIDKETIRRWLTGETDLTHGKMIALAGLFECDPYELISDKEVVIQKEAAYIAHHRKIVDAYLTLKPEDRPFVDRFMFPPIVKKDPSPPTPHPKIKKA